MSQSPFKIVMAIGLLLGGAVVMAKNVWPELLADPSGASDADADFDAFAGLEESGSDPNASELMEVGEVAEQAAATATPRGRLRADLLTLVGSYRPGTPVPNPFLTDIGDLVARPMVEVQLRWDGSNDPPPLRITMTMLNGIAARAVIDGQVLGVGDPTLAGDIAQIDATGVVVDAGKHHLHYDFDSPYPREFRDELARRAATAAEEDAARAQAAAGEAASSTGPVEPTINPPTPPRDTTSPWLRRAPTETTSPDNRSANPSGQQRS